MIFFLLFSIFPPFSYFLIFFPIFTTFLPFPPPLFPCLSMSYSFLFHLTSIQTICSGQKVFCFLLDPLLLCSFPMNSFDFPFQFKMRTVCLHKFSSLVLFIVLGFMFSLPILVCQYCCLSIFQRQSNLISSCHKPFILHSWHQVELTYRCVSEGTRINIILGLT